MCSGDRSEVRAALRCLADHPKRLAPPAGTASRCPFHHLHPMLTQWFRRWCRGVRWPRLIIGADLALPERAATGRRGPYAGRQGTPGCAALVDRREVVTAVPAGPFDGGMWREVHGRQDDGAVARWMSLGGSQPGALPQLRDGADCGPWRCADRARRRAGSSIVTPVSPSG